MKPHYPILDGVRGTAAMLVVIFHLFQLCFQTHSENPMHHGYLAVDFFYMLSGFVVGYAYDDRWDRMTIKSFLKIRFIRLHPLVLLGITIGAIAFWFDPYLNNTQQISFIKMIGVTLISFTLLPIPDIRGGDLTHTLNAPCWSLLQEYIANIIYAVFARKISEGVLWVIVIFSSIILTLVVVKYGDLDNGWGFDNIWIAPVRMMFPFFAGLLLFRIGKLVHIPMAYPLCSLLLILLFFLPTFRHRYNGLYEAGCVILMFPIIVAAGAGGQISGRWANVCKFLGKISYPIYITHFPLLQIYSHRVALKKTVPTQILPMAVGLFVFFILFAWISLKYYDEPVRAWLKKKF